LCADECDDGVVEKALRVFRPDEFTPPAKAASIRLIVENHRFFIDATLEPSEKKTVTHRLRVDTGSEDSVADDVVKEGTNVRETTLGNGLGANYKGYSGVFKLVRLGPFTFRDVWGPAVPHPGIGMEMFRRFVVTFDVPHRKLYLQPNQHFDEAFPSPSAVAVVHSTCPYHAQRSSWRSPSQGRVGDKSST